MEHFEEKELDRILRLSGLSLSKEERELLFSDLSRIVPYMERISKFGEEEPENSFSETTGNALFREDEEEESILSEEILQSAPARLESTFTVPRTVE